MPPRRSSTEAQQTYDALAAQLRTANEELAAAGTAAKENTSSSEAQNREQAKSQLPTARDSYDQALAAYNARADAVAQGNAGAVGLLSQISGLNRLKREGALYPVGAHPDRRAVLHDRAAAGAREGAHELR